jgi:hypothetical protein
MLLGVFKLLRFEPWQVTGAVLKADEGWWLGVSAWAKALTRSSNESIMPFMTPSSPARALYRLYSSTKF